MKTCKGDLYLIYIFLPVYSVFLEVIFSVCLVFYLLTQCQAFCLLSHSSVGIFRCTKGSICFIFLWKPLGPALPALAAGLIGPSCPGSPLPLTWGSPGLFLLDLSVPYSVSSSLLLYAFVWWNISSSSFQREGLWEVLRSWSSENLFILLIDGLTRLEF